MIQEKRTLSSVELSRLTNLTPEVEHTLNEMFTREHPYELRTNDEKYRTHATNSAFLTLARHLIAVVPAGEGRAEALKKLREAQMYCDSTIYSPY